MKIGMVGLGRMGANMSLRLIQNVEQNDFVAAMPEVVQALEHRLGVGQQVAEE